MPFIIIIEFHRGVAANFAYEAYNSRILEQDQNYINQPL